MCIWKAATRWDQITTFPWERMNYSVPFEYIKQKVDVQAHQIHGRGFLVETDNCSHPRLYDGLTNTAIQAHMPPALRSMSSGTVNGSFTGPVQGRQQHAGRCSGYSRQLGDGTAGLSPAGSAEAGRWAHPERLENACKQALEYTPALLSRIFRLFWHLAG